MATLSLPPRSTSSRNILLRLGEGRRLGRYELVTEIGVGGAARVWVGRGAQGLVAVKTLRPEYAAIAGTRRMLRDEASIASRIAHPNVLAVLDVGIEDDVPFYVMPLVEGGALSELVPRARGPLAPSIAARIALDLVRGLHAAHEANVVHRDVSPHNVLVGTDGVAKLADFGVAKAEGRLCDETETGQLKGKLAYMAPEQLGREAVDARTDVFAAGIVIWEMLTAKRLFRGQDVLQTIELVRTLEVPDPRTIAPSVPEAFAAVVLRALERDPERRFPSAGAMGDAIEAAGALASREEVGAIVARLFPPRVLPPAPSPSYATIVDDEMAPATITKGPPPRPPSVRKAWPLVVLAAILVAALIPTTGFLDPDAHTSEARPRTKALAQTPPPPPATAASPTAPPIPTVTPATIPSPPATHKRLVRPQAPRLKHPNPYGT
jgi:serine/threonine-protein kinase